MNCNTLKKLSNNQIKNKVAYLRIKKLKKVKKQSIVNLQLKHLAKKKGATK